MVEWAKGIGSYNSSHKMLVLSPSAKRYYYIGTD